ncbi:hypothetical protein GGS26DRAFT_590921 [Hypomontagnella submonticulosa]|nr:hypothetical protein GGS26DRAFT_590921 [Hypomontagnella submonticulosa]
MTGQMAGQINERGYPKLAGLMATSSEAAIFRQFRQLQMINLLRLQATLQDLENEYRDIRAKDSVYLSRSNLVDSFRLVRESAERGDDDESKHHDILVRIDEALIQVMAVSQARKPKTQDIKDLGEWLTRPSMGNNFLHGAEATIWEERNHYDLINPASKEDRSSSLLRLWAGLDRLWSSREEAS